MRRAAALLLSSLLGAGAFAANATKHVRVDGGTPTQCTGNADFAYPGSGTNQVCAYATIQNAVDNVTGSGNTIFVHAGTYTSPCTVTSSIQSVVSALVFIPPGKDGTSGAYNVVKAANDGTVTLNGSSCGEAFSVGSGFWQIGGLGAGEGFTFGDFRFRRQGDYSWEATVYLDGPNQRVYGNTFQGTSYLVVGSIDTDGEIRVRGDSVDIQNNTINMKGEGSAINLSSSFTLSGCNANGDLCLQNGSGCDCNGNHIIRGNVMQWDETFTSQDRHVCIFADGMHDPLIENNYCHIGSPARNATAANTAGGFYDRYWLRAIVRNNYIYTYGAEERGLMTQDCCSNERSVYVNNTWAGSSNEGFFHDGCDNCEIRNNIVRGDAPGGFPGGFGKCFQLALSGGSGGSGPVGYNSTFNCSAAYSNGSSNVVPSGHTNETANDITSDPLFVGSGNKPVPFYRLQATSPAINKGNASTFTRGSFSSVAKPTTDYDGDTRTGNPDIGADEQAGGGGGGTDTTPPGVITLQQTAPAKAPQLGRVLTWTATGDDGSTGTATSYQIRAKGDAVGAGLPTIANCSDGANMTFGLDAGGAAVTTIPAPLASGSSETFTLKGLAQYTEYAVAICACDEASNCTRSSVVTFTTPKAEGNGFRSTGGGLVTTVAPTPCLVANLNDSGSGSFRACATGNDFVMFAVGGPINLLTQIHFENLSNYTIDGSTAPNPGITIHPNPTVGINDMLRLGQGTNVYWNYLRLKGQFLTQGAASNLDLGFTVNTSVADSVLQNLVLDHMTIRQFGDSAWDLWDNVQDATLSHNFILFNQHPQTTGGDNESARITWHHNLDARNGERHPQFVDVHTDMDIRYNVNYDWSAKLCSMGTNEGTSCPNGNECTGGGTCIATGGSSAIRIRNTPAGATSANIVVNKFIPGANINALVYGADPGCEAEEGTCGSCSGQNISTGAASPCGGPTMGQLYVAGNGFSSTQTDSYSTVASERPTAAGADVTPDSLAGLCTSVVGTPSSPALPIVGTHYPTADETALINEVRVAMSCGTVVPPDVIKDVKLKGTTFK